MAGKSVDERIAALQEKQKQLKAQENKLKAQQSQKKRKEEAHRKIEVGGVVESVLGRPIEHEELPRLIAFLKAQEDRGQYFSNFMNRKE